MCSYLLPLRAIWMFHNIGYHIYVEDTQLYVSFKCKQLLEAISKLNICFVDIRRWMITNKLKINDSKTLFIVFRFPQLKCDLSGLSVNVGGSMTTQSSKVRDLLHAQNYLCQHLNIVFFNDKYNREHMYAQMVM